MAFLRRKPCEKCALAARRARDRKAEVELLRHQLEAANARLEERDRTIATLSDLLKTKGEREILDTKAAMTRMAAEFEAQKASAEAEEEAEEKMGGVVDRIQQIFGSYDQPPPTTVWAGTILKDGKSEIADPGEPKEEAA